MIGRSIAAATLVGMFVGPGNIINCLVSNCESPVLMRGGLFTENLFSVLSHVTFKPRRSEGFTVIATLDPLVASKEDIQTAIDLFDGVIEIYEKAMTERTRRFLLVKKLYARRYSENEPMLDRRQALLEHNHDKVAARVLLGVVSSVG